MVIFETGKETLSSSSEKENLQSSEEKIKVGKKNLRLAEYFIFLFPPFNYRNYFVCSLIISAIDNTSFTGYVFCIKLYIYIYIYCESRLQSRLLMPRSSMLGLLRQTVVNFPVVQSTQNYKHGSNGRCVFSFAVSEKFKACECKHFPLHLLYRLQFVISSPIPCSLSPHRLEQ